MTDHHALSVRREHNTQKVKSLGPRTRSVRAPDANYPRKCMTRISERSSQGEERKGQGNDADAH